MDYRCLNCGESLPEDWDPKYCCDGLECGCMGLPTEPQVCSQECWDAMIEKIGGKRKEGTMKEPRKTRRYKRKMKRRKVMDKVWTILQKIIMGDAGRVGTSGVCLRYLEDELPDKEKVIITFSFGILTTAADGVHFFKEMEDLEEGTQRNGLGMVISPSNAAEYVKDLIASGFNPAVMWGVDGLLKIRNVDDLIEAGDDLKKLSDLVDPKDLKRLGEWEEEDELDREYGITPPGEAGPDVWFMDKSTWFESPPEDRLYFLEYMESVGKEEIILTDEEGDQSYPVDMSLDIYRGWKRRKDQGIDGTEPNEWEGRLAPILKRECEDVPEGRRVTVKPGEVTTHYGPQDPEGSDLQPGWDEKAVMGWDPAIPKSIQPLIPEILIESKVPQIQEAFVISLEKAIEDRKWREKVHQMMMDSDPE